MPPWIGPGPHDRDLDHQVVEAARAAAAAACSSARASRSGTRRPCRPADHVVGRRILRRDVLHAAIVPRRSRRSGRAHLRIAVSMPSASTSTLSRPSASRSSLSHWMTRAVGHRRVLDRHQLAERSARDDEAADVLRQVPRKAEQLARPARTAPDDGRLGIKPPRRSAADTSRRRPSMHAPWRGDRPVRVEARAPCRRRASRSSAGS